MNLKKNAKSGLYPRGATWMRRGTPGHVAAPRGPTWHIYIYIYIYLLHIIKGSSALPIWGGLLIPINRRVL